MSMFLLPDCACADTLLAVHKSNPAGLLKAYRAAMRRMPVDELTPAVIAMWREEDNWHVKSVSSVSYVSGTWCDDDDVPEDSHCIPVYRRQPFDLWLQIKTES